MAEEEYTSLSESPTPEAVRLEFIELFIEVAQTLGLPKSYGAIYGLLYTSPEPLTIGDVMRELQSSKGSASQGLRALLALNAARRVYVQGDRRDYYVAEISLRRLVSGMIREKIQPGLENTRLRLDRLEAMVEESGAEDPFLSAQIKRSRDWNNKASRLLPFMANLLGRKQPKD